MKNLGVNTDKAVALIMEEIGEGAVDIFISHGPNAPEWLKKSALQLRNIIKLQVENRTFKEVEDTNLQ